MNAFLFRSAPWAFLCVLSSAAFSQVDFQVTAHVPELDPTTAVVADLDGDGDIDIAARAAVQPHAPGDWFLLRNRGEGAFDAPIPNYPGGDFTLRALFDIDGDGDVDAVGTTQAFTGDTIVVAENDGTGRFQTVSITPYLGVSRLRVADLDSDSDLDVLVLNQIPLPQWTVLRNQAGTLVFEAPTSIHPLNLQDFHLADVDLDGDPDALAVLDGRELLLFENDGTGNLGVPLRSPLPPRTNLLDVGDLDRDGDVDPLVVTEAFDPITRQGLRSFQVLENDGTGLFAGPRALFHVPDVALLPDRGWLVDLDLDGSLDFLVASLDGVRVAYQGALGTFQLDSNGPWSFTPADAPFPLADLDGDGDLDLVGGTRGDVDAVQVLSNGLLGMVAQYPFNEVRGRGVANAVVRYPAAAPGLASRSDWRQGTGRPSFRGPQPGTGCLGHDQGVTVETGLEVAADRGLSWMFWFRERRPNTTPLVPRHVFTISNATGLSYTCSVEGDRLVFASGSIRARSVRTFGNSPGTWHHVALTLDPATSTVQFTFDGVAEPPVNPGFLGMPLAGTLRIAPGGFSARPITELHDLDDFRVYRGVVDASTIQRALRGESSSISGQADGCLGITGPLGIEWLPNFGVGATNEVRLSVTRASGGRPVGVLGVGLSNVAFAGVPLPLPISTYCDLAIAPDVILSSHEELLSTNTWTGTYRLPLPTDPALFDAHLYLQGVALFFLANEITTSESLDVSLKLR